MLFIKGDHLKVEVHFRCVVGISCWNGDCDHARNECRDDGMMALLSISLVEGG